MVDDCLCTCTHANESRRVWFVSCSVTRCFQRPLQCHLSSDRFNGGCTSSPTSQYESNINRKKGWNGKKSAFERVLCKFLSLVPPSKSYSRSAAALKCYFMLYIASSFVLFVVCTIYCVQINFGNFPKYFHKC